MNWKLAAEISGAIMAGLIFIPFVLMIIRTKIEGSDSVWIPADVSEAEDIASREGWILRSLVAFDIACNVIIFWGEQDETISTHAWRDSLENKLWGRLMNRWLEWWQPNHGLRAASGDLQRATVRVLILKKVLGVKDGLVYKK